MYKFFSFNYFNFNKITYSKNKSMTTKTIVSWIKKVKAAIKT